MIDPRVEYDFALRAIRSGSTREERRQAIIEEYLKERPENQHTDLNIVVTDTLVTESVRVVTRPATTEELAQLKIAQFIDETQSPRLSTSRTGKPPEGVDPVMAADHGGEARAGPSGGGATPASNHLGLGVPQERGIYRGLAQPTPEEIIDG